MSRRRKGRRINGWLIIDKPSGITSTAVVGRIKRLTDAAKAGHGGTLDPLATGILPIALGEATKTVMYVMDAAKRYRFTVRFGASTTTDDSEGGVLKTSDDRPTDAAIEAYLPDFTGTIMQRPPDFAAIKIQGERAYDIARRGDVVDLPERPVRIDELVLVERPDADHAVFEAACGKGAYIRALARDLGERVQVEDASIEALPHPDEHFDLLWCRGVLVHVAEVAPALRECHRVLRPDGAMLLMLCSGTELLCAAEARLLCERMGFVADNLMGRAAIEALLETTGFDVERSEELGGEFAEHYQALDGRCLEDLLRIAHLQRGREGFIAEFGRDRYETVLGMCYWQVYQLLGKISYKAYLLRKH